MASSCANADSCCQPGELTRIEGRHEILSRHPIHNARIGPPAYVQTKCDCVLKRTDVQFQAA
jgi:hypothetical protein